jgi:hypothetical protein
MTRCLPFILFFFKKGAGDAYPATLELDDCRVAKNV